MKYFLLQEDLSYDLICRNLYFASHTAQEFKQIILPMIEDPLSSRILQAESEGQYLDQLSDLQGWCHRTLDQYRTPTDAEMFLYPLSEEFNSFLDNGLQLEMQLLFRGLRDWHACHSVRALPDPPRPRDECLATA